MPTVIALVVVIVLGGVGGGIYLIMRRHRSAADTNSPGGGQQDKDSPRAEPIKPPPTPSQPQVTVFPQTKAKDPQSPSPKLRQMIADIDRADPT
jgi:hypothetical protein